MIPGSHPPPATPKFCATVCCSPGSRGSMYSYVVLSLPRPFHRLWAFVDKARCRRRATGVPRLCSLSHPVPPLPLVVVNRLAQATTNQDPSEIFDLDVLLGKGAFGEVYKARHKKASTRMTVAVKIMRIGRTNKAELLNELKVLQGLRSPYCVSYHGSYIKASKLWVRNGRVFFFFPL